MQKKGNKYGTHRVIEPKGVLPQPANKIDNNIDEIYDNEILIDVQTLNVDSASFTDIHEYAKKQAGEGASEEQVLEEIKKEKAKFIKEGKVKKEKPLTEITEDEIPFDVPENWCWCRLSELCNLYTGDSINETEKKLKYTNIKEGWFYIGTKDVNFDQTINYDNGIKIPFEKENFRIAPKNTVLMCIEGGSAGRKIAFTNQDVCFGNKLCCFNSYKNEIEKFIFYFLQSTLFTDAFKDNINGIIGGVSINNLKGMLFPLPPLAEQKRIVDVIEKMLPLCEKLGE